MNTRNDGYVIRFGMIRNSRSIAATASITAQNAHRSTMRYGELHTAAVAANDNAVASSSTGYRAGIRIPQLRHRPRSRR